jgi:predicted alpha/beta-hydrolase family hydrolase
MPPNNDVLTVPTPFGDARVALDHPSETNGTALLFHGAGGDMNAAVLLAVRDALLGAGWTVARLDQPYRVAGRRAPAPAHQLDAVALLVADAVRGEGPLLLAGKSSGARVACRTARAAGAGRVVALGFPLHPPGRPDKSRADELTGAGVPVLVLQGSRDTFGTPEEIRAAVGKRRGFTVREVAGGDHSFNARRADGRSTADCLAEVATVTVRWAARRPAQPAT